MKARPVLKAALSANLTIVENIPGASKTSEGATLPDLILSHHCLASMEVFGSLQSYACIIGDVIVPIMEPGKLVRWIQPQKCTLRHNTPSQ